MFTYLYWQCNIFTIFNATDSFLLQVHISLTLNCIEVGKKSGKAALAMLGGGWMGQKIRNQAVAL